MTSLSLLGGVAYNTRRATALMLASASADDDDAASCQTDDDDGEFAAIDMHSLHGLLGSTSTPAHAPPTPLEHCSAVASESCSSQVTPALRRRRRYHRLAPPTLAAAAPPLQETARGARVPYSAAKKRRGVQPAMSGAVASAPVAAMLSEPLDPRQYAFDNDEDTLASATEVAVAWRDARDAVRAMRAATVEWQFAQLVSGQSGVPLARLVDEVRMPERPTLLFRQLYTLEQQRRTSSSSSSSTTSESSPMPLSQAPMTGPLDSVWCHQRTSGGGGGGVWATAHTPWTEREFLCRAFGAQALEAPQFTALLVANVNVALQRVRVRCAAPFVALVRCVVWADDGSRGGRRRDSGSHTHVKPLLRSLFASLVAALVNMAQFYGNRAPARATDYARYQAKAEDALRQLALAQRALAARSSL